MAGIVKTLTGWLKKSSGPDWGTLERYLAWAFGGGASASGIIVNPQTALQSAAVYACIQVLAQSVGMLPLNIYSDDPDGNRTEARDHPLWEILHNQPNEFQTAPEFWEMAVMALCLRGNAYAYVNRTRSGAVVELLPLHPDMVRCEMSADFRLSYQITMPDGGFKQMFPGDILHIRGLSLNGWLGISPIAYARESIGLALATEKFGAQLFRNGAKMGGILEHPGKISDASYSRIKETFDAASSGENAHRTALLEEGMKFSKVSMNADEAQFLATRQYQRSEIAGIFRVPAHMIGDLDKATFSNIENLGLQFVNYSLMPWFVRIEKAIRRDLIAKSERKTIRVKFNPSALLRGDAAARASYFSKALGAGGSPAWMTQDNVRKVESEFGMILNPMGGTAAVLPIATNVTANISDPNAPAAGAAP